MGDDGVGRRQEAASTTIPSTATPIRHYRGSILVISTLAALPVFFAVLALQRNALDPALQDIATHGLQVSATTQTFLLLVLGIPVGVAIGLGIILTLAIHLFRYAIYANALHADLSRQIKRYTPLYRNGPLPQFIHFDAHGKPVPTKSLPLLEALQTLPHVLLVGESGTGKTTALMAIAHHLSSKRQTFRLAFGKALIPVYIQLDQISTGESFTEQQFIQVVEACFLRYNSAGLSARLSRLLKHGRLLLLFDDLDAVPPDARRTVYSVLARCCTNRYPSSHFIFNCSLSLYTEEPALLRPLTSCERLIFSGFHENELPALLERAKPPRGRAVEKRLYASTSLRAELQEHHLQSAMTLPADTIALVTLLHQQNELPYGHGELWEQYVTLLCRQSCPRDVQPERYQHFLATLASALHAAQIDYLPHSSPYTLGQSYLSFLKHHPYMAACELGVSPLGDIEDLDEQEATRVCQAALDSGILRADATGSALSFAYRLLRGAFATSFLRSTNDQLGRLNAELLRPYWRAPLLLWAGDTGNFADLAARLLRLADTPDSTAIRAYITTHADVYPTILAHAIAIMAEGQTCRFASTKHDSRLTQQIAPQAELHLRNVLDQIQLHSDAPDDANRLGSALRSIEQSGGEDIAANFAYLINQPQLSRLVRGQLISLLGLMATPAAIDALVALLDESDPVIWQALQQAFALAGAGSLRPLQTALQHGSVRAQAHAAEALTFIGAAAVEAAQASLRAPDPAQRAAAARAIGTLGARQAEGALIALLDDPNIAVQMATIHTLEQFKTPQAVLALEQHTTAASPVIRVRIAEALGACRDTHALPTLILLLDDPDPEVVAAAATALGKLGDDRALITLRKRRHDYNPWIQSAVVEALRRLGDIQR